MADLARELSGNLDNAPAAPPPAPTPADYWKEQLRGARPTPLPATVPPESIASHRPVHSSLVLTEAISGRLRLFADQTGVPISTLFHGTWAMLLHRYTGEEDLLFGVVKGCIDRETNPDDPTVHVVPARAVIDPNSQVRLWLRALADKTKEAAPFEFITLDQICAAAGLSASSPPFETVLAIGHEGFDPSSIVAGTNLGAATSAHHYPLVAAAYPGREITLRVAGTPKAFSDAALQYLLGHWQILLGSLCESADLPIDKVRMLTSAERHHLTAELNATDAAWPSSACVHDLFEQQVEKTPDMPALMFGKQTLSYRELNDRANRLASELRRRGIVPDSVIGICIERSFEMVVAVLAALKAGAAYLPLDPSYPHDRLRFMLEDSRAALLLTQRKLEQVFPGVATPALFVDEEDQRTVVSEPIGNLERTTVPENLSYLIYTSGSTGRPKGVAMIHRALVNLIDWQLKQSRVGEGQRTLQFTSLSFDVSFQEIFSTLCSGGTLVLITAEMRLSPRELWSFIVREQVARIFLPFVALQQLADAAAAEGTVATALREVITAGEQLQVTPKLRELFGRHPQATLHNHYGPSETHVVTALELTGDPAGWPALPSIGFPIQNTQIYLLDRHQEPVPLGLPGELYIGGTALARGYFERPDVTSEKFVRDPFRREPGARLYKTGDLARYLPNGQIEFLGRIDHQVKIRGYRVELGEIEAALSRQPGVGESAVVARERAPGDKQLVAYVVPVEGQSINGVALRAALKEQLPEYMVPAAFVVLERLPLTPSGKVDRKSLPAPGDAQPGPVSPADPKERPWLPIQFQLVQIWEELLGVKPVGLRDNFFELGGHSLLAVKMIDRIEEVTGCKLPVTTLFEHATVIELADLILNKDNGAAQPVIEVQTAGTQPPMYFLHGDIIGGGFYARDVSRLLGHDQPFYVLPPVNVPAGELSSVEDMAAQHLKDLRAHRSTGPYLLGGFCIGALVAYEMARRLRDAGEEVPLVVLIDPQLASNLLRAHLRFSEALGRRRGFSVAQRTQLFMRGYKALFRLREEWNAPWREKARFVAAAFKRVAGPKGKGMAPQPTADALPNPMPVKDEQDVLGRLLWMISAYKPVCYEGRVAMFLTDEQKELAPFLPRKWRAVAPRLEMHRVPGRHLGAITTDVEQLAEKLRVSLAGCRSHNATGDISPA